MPYIVAVSGGSFYANRRRVYSVLDGLHQARTIDLLIQGQCHNGGADKLAEDWAQDREVPCLSIPARWRTGKAGRGEGPIRNRVMPKFLGLDALKPSEWVLFPGGNGTADAKQVAIHCGIKVTEISAQGRLSRD